jgi:hypothetical protein
MGRSRARRSAPWGRSARVPITNDSRKSTVFGDGGVSPSWLGVRAEVEVKVPVRRDRETCGVWNELCSEVRGYSLEMSSLVVCSIDVRPGFSACQHPTVGHLDDLALSVLTSAENEAADG